MMNRLFPLAVLAVAPLAEAGIARLQSTDDYYPNQGVAMATGTRQDVRHSATVGRTAPISYASQHDYGNAKPFSTNEDDACEMPSSSYTDSSRRRPAKRAMPSQVTDAAEAEPQDASDPTTPSVFAVTAIPGPRQPEDEEESSPTTPSVFDVTAIPHPQRPDDESSPTTPSVFAVTAVPGPRQPEDDEFSPTTPSVFDVTAIPRKSQPQGVSSATTPALSSTTAVPSKSQPDDASTPTTPTVIIVTAIPPQPQADGATPTVLTLTVIPGPAQSDDVSAMATTSGASSATAVPLKSQQPDEASAPTTPVGRTDMAVPSSSGLRPKMGPTEASDTNFGVPRPGTPVIPGSATTASQSYANPRAFSTTSRAKTHHASTAKTSRPCSTSAARASHARKPLPYMKGMSRPHHFGYSN
ncbi:hypothetical protein XA68_17536 [Ophiocordyceps unilateralis]|uniref:Uncharacterized protein n=1 Tax=Ophiocordyceps unilateralis TaxID=268505 RepID=A0A2A9PJ34_OPHUN|nr:hypothetical protein XA68_17536 [Ophiocordyceps unilateralis]